MSGTSEKMLPKNLNELTKAYVVFGYFFITKII